MGSTITLTCQPIHRMTPFRGILRLLVQIEGVAVVILRTVLLALLILSPTVFWYGTLEPFELCKSALTQFSALIVLVIAVGCSTRDRLRSATRLLSGPIGIAVVFGLVVAVLTTLTSRSPWISLQGDDSSRLGLGQILALVVLFAASRAVAAHPDGLPWLYRGALFGAAVPLGYALLQLVGLDPFSWDQLSAYQDWLRPVGTLGHPTYLGGYLAMLLPILAGLIVQEGGWGRSLAVAVLGLALLILVATLARAAWLAALTTALFAVCLVSLPRRPRLWVGCLGLGGVIFAVAWGCGLLAPVADRLARVGQSPERWTIWETSWRIFLHHPWLGSGLDTFALAFAEYRTPEYWKLEWGYLPRRAHNDLLQALATQGVIGGLAYLALPLALLWTTIQVWRRQPDRRRDTLMLTGCCLAFYVQNCFGFAVATTSLLLIVAAAGLASLTDALEEPLTATKSPPVHRPRLVLASLAAVPLVWVIAGPVLASRCAYLAVEDPSWLAQAVSIAPCDPGHRFRLAQSKLGAAELATSEPVRLRLLAEAWTQIDEACRLAPAAQNHALRGRILLQCWRHGKASPKEVLACFDESLRLDGCDSRHWADAANAATLLGRLDKAEYYLNEGLAIDPDLLQLQIEQGTFLLARSATLPPDQRFPARREACTVLEKVVERIWTQDELTRDRLLLVLALAYLDTDRPGEARRMVEDIQRRRPEWREARWLRALAVERMHRPKLATRLYREILQEQPDNPYALQGLRRLGERP